MALTKVSGPVSNFRETTEIKSANSTTGAFGMGRTTFKTQKMFNFRVGNRPVSMKYPTGASGGIDLTDGDEATVVGIDGSSGIKGLVVRNDGTGIAYSAGVGFWLGWGAFMTILGLVLTGAIIGFAIFPVGLYMLYKGFQLKKAMAVLSA